MEIGTLFNSVEGLFEVTSQLPTDEVIVYTYGAWDLLHPGHVIFLNRAKEMGTYLIVGVVEDRPIRELKGDDRPVQKVKDRQYLISNIKSVDATIIQPEYDPTEYLKKLIRVDILTKGDDWDYIPGQEIIKVLGGELIKLNYTNGYSTSSLFSKINAKN